MTTAKSSGRAARLTKPRIEPVKKEAWTAEQRKLLEPLERSGRVYNVFATMGNHPAIIPTISGQAWITGQSTLMLDPADPWPAGYRISDTWPKDGAA